jgi:hypothetical protein
MAQAIHASPDDRIELVKIAAQESDERADQGAHRRDTKLNAERDAAGIKCSSKDVTLEMIYPNQCSRDGDCRRSIELISSRSMLVKRGTPSVTQLITKIRSRPRNMVG